MRISRIATMLVIGSACALLLGMPITRGQGRTLRGWLSDEACARGRATGGVYTGTNPDCAKRCVGEGKKIVLVLLEEKEILVVTNQEAVEENLGDYVEITGTIGALDKTVRVGSLKMLEKGRAMCSSRPRSQEKDRK